MQNLRQRLNNQSSSAVLIPLLKTIEQLWADALTEKRLSKTWWFMLDDFKSYESYFLSIGSSLEGIKNIPGET